MKIITSLSISKLHLEANINDHISKMLSKNEMHAPFKEWDACPTWRMNTTLQNQVFSGVHMWNQFIKCLYMGKMPTKEYQRNVKGRV